MAESTATEAHFDDEAYRGRFDPQLWLRLSRHAAPFRRPIVALCLCGVLMAAVDTALPLVTASLIDAAIAGADGATIASHAAVYLALVVVLCAIVFGFINLAGAVATGIEYDLREKGFRHLQSLSFSYFDKRPVRWIVTRLTSDINKIAQQVPWLFLDLVWGPAFILLLSGAMFALSPKLAIWVVAVLPALVLITAFFQSRLLRSQREVRKTNSRLTAAFSECLMGVRTTKSLTRERENLHEFQELSSTMHHHSLRNALQSAVYLPLVTFMGGLAVGLALWRGAEIMALPSDDGVLDTGLTPGELVAFMQFAGMLALPIQDLAMHFTRLQSAQASAERLQSMLDAAPEVRETPAALDAIAAQQSRIAAGETHPNEPIDGGDAVIDTLTFENISFWYVEGEPVLRDLSLNVRAGQTVAFVGPTGGGKSTTVSLAARFYEPCEGRIAVNGVDYRDRSLAWLQSQLGVVLQTPHLFNDTVRENIRYGRLDASQDEIVAAAELAGAHAFITSLEHGYDTVVGEAGGNLSTGQRQLVSLARAVLADPQIVIMDEATSSVDTETERVIQSAIERVLDGRIAFVIAHRLSTIRRADLICVIEAGRIVERGSHDELMARHGAYFQLYTKQFVSDAGG